MHEVAIIGADVSGRTAGPEEGDGLTPTAVVTEFFARVQARDLSALDLVADDLLYVNVPFTTSRSKGSLERLARLLMRLPVTWEARIDHVASQGDLVLTERTEIFRVGPLEVSFWAIGHHEVHGGRMTVWRDYFDYTDAAAALPRAVVRLLSGKRY